MTWDFIGNDLGHLYQYFMVQFFLNNLKVFRCFSIISEILSQYDLIYDFKINTGNINKGLYKKVY